jgi:ribonuclease HII
MLFVGIDEVGYGPKLGPFIISTAYAKAKKEPCWALFGPAITNDYCSKDKIVVCDSKKIFNHRRGIVSLEPNVLPFIYYAKRHFELNYHSLLDLFGIKNDIYPWYENNLNLPLAVSQNVILGRYRLLKNIFSRCKINKFDIKLRFIEPAEFNKLITVYKKKSRLLSQESFRLISMIVDETSKDDIYFVIGKHGGMRYYLPAIIQNLDDVQLLDIWEEKENSRYLIKYKDKKVTLIFMQDAEDKSLLVALASMIGKYIRELSMRLFNNYWIEKTGTGLKPTAGYSPDAERFLSLTKSAFQKENINPECLIRAK